MDSSLLQSPTNADDTYRVKAGKSHREYVANVEESVGENGSVVTDYQYEPNNHSDSQFMKERLEQLNRQDDTVTFVTDGAYGGDENIRLAKDKNGGRILPP